MKFYNNPRNINIEALLVRNNFEKPTMSEKSLQSVMESPIFSHVRSIEEMAKHLGVNILKEIN